MDNSIRVTSEMISLEAANPISALRALSGRFPDLVTAIATFINGEESKWKGSIDTVETRKLEKLLSDKKFTDVYQMTAYVPPGLQVSYAEYLSALEDSQRIVDELLEKTLRPYAKWLAVALTQPEMLSTVRVKELDLKDIIIHDLDGQTKALTSKFHRSHNSDTVTVGDVYANLKEIPKVTKTINAINQRLITISKKELVEVMGTIAGHLETLVKRVKADPETYEVSGKVLKMLSDMTYALAVEVEFFSTHSYRMMGLTKAVNDTVSELTDNLK